MLDILIVGAGPAGIAAAVEAKKNGLTKVLVLEKGAEHSQMIRTFYKEGKRVDAGYAGLEAICFGLMCIKDGDREGYLAFMDFVIAENKIPMRYRSEVGSISQTPEHIFEVSTSDGHLYRAKSIVISIGKMGKPNQPDYWKEIPPTLRSNKTLLFDINSRPLEGQSVLVVGGGDSASEYVQMLAPTNKVTLSYRRDSFSKMNPKNLALLQALLDQKNVVPLLPSNIEKIADDSGRPQVFFKEHGGAGQTFDAVLFGLGGMTPTEFLRNAQVTTGTKGESPVNEFYESNVKGIYIVGDLLGKGRGGGSIIAAFNSAAKAVHDIVENRLGLKPHADVVLLGHKNF